MRVIIRILQVVLTVCHLVRKQRLLLQQIPGHLEVPKIKRTLFTAQIQIWKSNFSRHVVGWNSLLVVFYDFYLTTLLKLDEILGFQVEIWMLSGRDLETCQR